MSQSKKALGQHHEVQPLAPNLSNLFEWVTEPTEASRYRRIPTTGIWEVLMGWKGLLEHDATWKVAEDFKQQFPNFHLEDKVCLEGEGNEGH